MVLLGKSIGRNGEEDQKADDSDACNLTNRLCYVKTAEVDGRSWYQVRSLGNGA